MRRGPFRRPLLDAEGPTPPVDYKADACQNGFVQGPVAARWKGLNATSNGLRVLLDVADRDMRRVRWELLHDKTRRLGTTRARPMARAAPSYPQPAGEIVAWPLRLLVIVGIAESDFCAFAEEELDELPEAFRKICGLVDVEFLLQPSRTAIRDMCHEMSPHVIHVMAHGDLDGGGNACLLIEDKAAGGAWQWTAPDIPEDLPATLPRLVVLNACRSTKIDGQDAAWGGRRRVPGDGRRSGHRHAGRRTGVRRSRIQLRVLQGARERERG